MSVFIPRRAVLSTPARYPIDPILLFSTLALLTIGLVMVSSASMDVAAARLDNPFNYGVKHFIFLCVSIVAALITFMIPISFWRQQGWTLLVVSGILLISVLIPGLGKEVNGSMRWIRLGGMNVQPSEIAKLFVVIYLSCYLNRHLEAVRSSWMGFAKPMMVIAMLAILLLAEPDFGATVVLGVTAIAMLFLAGARLSQFIFLLVLVCGMAALLAVAQPYRMQRLVSFTNPWAAENVYGGGYQLTQALIAFGRGEWQGLGLGNSVQKLFFLPEAHTDFLFSIIGEEFGFIGCLITLLLFVGVVFRAMWIGREAERSSRPFAAFVAYGIGVQIGIQTFINIGVNIGLLPTKGLTLPFLSYGGSSLLVSCVSVAILLRISYELRQPDKGGVLTVASQT